MSEELDEQPSAAGRVAATDFKSFPQGGHAKWEEKSVAEASLIWNKHLSDSFVLGQWEGLLPVQNILKENKEILNCRHSF
jgi:hypothetical protein